MATGTIPHISTIKSAVFSISSGHPATLTFQANVRGEIHCTGTGGAGVRGIISFSADSGKNLGFNTLAGATGVTITTSGNVMTVSATASCLCCIEIFAGDMPAIATS